MKKNTALKILIDALNEISVWDQATQDNADRDAAIMLWRGCVGTANNALSKFVGGRRMKKDLTLPQVNALELLAKKPGDYYDLAKVGARGPTLAFLVKNELAEKVTLPDGTHHWEITEGGRSALSRGWFKCV